jgi:hypothetical protein
MKAGASTLGEVQAFLSPTLDASAVEVSNQALDCGNLHLAMESGTVTRVLVAGQVVGLYFNGKGSLSYLSKDPAEAEVIRYNLDRNGGRKPVAGAGGLSIVDGLKEALLFYAGQALPAIQGSPAKAPGEDFNTQVDWFDADTRPFPGHLAALAANAPGKAMISGFIRGKEARYVFLRDEASERKETLSLVQWREIPAVPYLKVVPLSCTWLEGSQKRPPSPTFSVTQVDQDIKVHAKSSMELDVLETVVSHRPNLKVLDFQLRSNIISRPNSVNFEKLPVRIQAVETEDGHPLAFDHRMGRLLVNFPQGLPADVPVKVRFKLGGLFLKEHLGSEIWDLGKEAWFPMATEGSRAFKARMRLQVDKPFFAICPGRVVRQEATAEANILETALDRPVGSLAFRVGRYHEAIVRDPRTKVALHLDTNAFDSSPARSERLASTVHGLIAFYETFLGPFPFEDLRLVSDLQGAPGGVVPGMISFSSRDVMIEPGIASRGHRPWESRDGMAEPGITSRGRMGGTPYPGESTIFDSTNYALAQAVAAQYWGVAVRGRGLDEGPVADLFSSFCGWVAVSNMKDIGKLRSDQVFNRWKGALPVINDVASISHADWLVPGNRDSHREGWFASGLKGYKGPLVLEQLCREVGARKFTEFMGAFQKEFAWKLCDAQDLPEVLNRITGKDWQPFFEKYYWGAARPE